MSVRYFLLVLVFLILTPTEGYVSSVVYTEQSLHDVTVASKLIIIARREPVMFAQQKDQPFQSTPYFTIERILIDREARNLVKAGDRISVFDASRELNESLGASMEEHKLTTPPYSPVVPRYASTLSAEDFGKTERMVLFLVPYKDKKDEFMFAMDRAYEVESKAQEIVAQIK